MAAALALTTVAADVSAKGPAGLGKPSGGHFIRHHRPFSGYGAYGGVFVAGQAQSEPAESPAQPVISVIQAAYALKCSHSEEVKVVPSEGGGTREITIRRC